MGTLYADNIPAVLLFSLLLLIPLYSAVWAYRDAERRGKSGLLVALMVLFVMWPWSLLIWIVFRPERTYH